MTTLLVILLVIIFISGAPLFTIMLGATALGLITSSKLEFESGFNGAINKLFGTSDRDEMTALSTMPLFIYAGYVLAEAKTADRLVRFANALLGWLPGGLAIVTILTCALFTVFTGASGVTIIALGGVLMPALVRNGYPERFSMGLIAGTGSVGLLFPPALPLFIYGTVYGLVQSDEEKANNVWDTGRFLFAGAVPGLVLIAMLGAVAVAVALIKKLPRQKFSMKELGTSFVVAIPELGIPIGVVALLANGIGLSEIAALTVVYVTILEMAVFRTIKIKTLWAISYEAMAMIGAIFLIILASTALTDYVVNAHVPQKMVHWTQSHVSSKIVFLLAINVLLLIVGTMMDIFSAIVVVLPLIAPISRAYGIDPYHLGVIFLLNLEVGYLHPPVGLNLFLTSVKFQRPITEVMWATVPFLITMLVSLFVITYIPSLTVVPPAKRTDRVTNLVEIVRNGIEESKVSIPELPLVDYAGNALLVNKKPVVRKFIDCKPKPAPKPPETCAEWPASWTIIRPCQLKDGKPVPLSKDDLDHCQSLFLNVSEECKPDPKKPTPEQKQCIARQTAKWVVDRYNEDHIDEAAIPVDKLTFVDAAGKPFTIKDDEKDARGNVVKDDSGDAKKIDKPIVDKDGKPVTRTLAWCGELLHDADKEHCRSLFIAASACAINPDEPDEDCVKKACPDGAAPAAPATGSGSDAGSGSGSDAGSGSGAGSAGSGSGSGSAGLAPPAGDCHKKAIATCLKPKIDACIVDATKSWVEDYPSVAYNPPLGQKKPELVEDSDDSCSATGGTGGLLVVGAALVALRRRRRRA